MRRLIRSLHAPLRTAALVATPLAFGWSADAAPAGEGLLLEPVAHAVYQRNEHQQAQVPVECAPGPGQADGFDVRAVPLDATSAPTGTLPDWQHPPVELRAGRLHADLTLPAGWYRLDVRLRHGTQDVATTSVSGVGVGDVFITCGQSNSANHGKPPQKAEDPRVSSRDFATGAWHHGDDPQPGASGRGGSPWALLGDRLVRRTGCPVGFLCVGVGSTEVGAWLPKGKCGTRIKAALKLAGPRGVRAILWHQGESDSITGTSTETYAQRLGQVIAQARQDGGWDMPWGVAQASYVPNAKATPDNQQAVLAGQRQVLAQVPGVFAGPATDDYHLKHWVADGVHFNAEGLTAHAEGWLKALDPLLPPTIAHP